MTCPKCRFPIREPAKVPPGFAVACSECCLKEKSMKNVVVAYRKTV